MSLQDGDKKTLEGAAGNFSEWIHSPTQENRLCLCCGSSRIYKEAFDRRERVQFSYSLTIWCKNLFKKLQAIENQNTQKCKGRVVLRGHTVKDDSGAHAVFTEQGSSASQMNAAKVMDVIAGLPGCAGQAADAVSAFTRVNLEDAPKLLKIPKSESPDLWPRLPRHEWPKSWEGIEDPVVLLERILYGLPLTGLLWERQFGEVLLGRGWRIRTDLGMSSLFTENRDCSCRYTWMI